MEGPETQENGQQVCILIKLQILFFSSGALYSKRAGEWVGCHAIVLAGMSGLEAFLADRKR